MKKCSFYIHSVLTNLEALIVFYMSMTGHRILYSKNILTEFENFFLDGKVIYIIYKLGSYQVLRHLWLYIVAIVDHYG